MNFFFLILVFLICLGLTYVILLWSPQLGAWLGRFYEKEKQSCELNLGRSLIELGQWEKPFFYLMGPFIVSLACLLFLPGWPMKTGGVILFSFLFLRMGRWAAQFLYNRRLKLIKTDLIDALGLIASSLRAGLSLNQSIEMAAQEMFGPVAEEFGQILKENRLGQSLEQSFVNFKKRVPLREVEVLVNSILILKETGGNLAETFDILTHTLREEQRVQDKIKTLTTQGVAQAVVISSMPFFLGFALYSISPEYMTPLWSHWLGWVFIFIILFLQSIGVFIMTRILRIEI